MCAPPSPQFIIALRIRRRPWPRLRRCRRGRLPLGLALAAGLAAAGAPATAQLRIADEPPPGFEDLVAPGPEAATPAESGLRLSDEPPPGFEDLLEPETAPIDVYVGGRAIGSYLATFTPRTISFDDPSAIAASIPGLEAVDRVAGALTGDLSTNAAARCVRPGQPPGCGVLEPETAAVLFDPARFRADLFLDPTLLGPPGGGPRYLPAPALVPSFLTGLAGSLSTDADSTSWSLAANAGAAIGPARVESTLSLSGAEGPQVETLAAQWDRRGISLRAGLFDTRPNRLFGDQRVYGFSLGTTLDTRADLDVAYGSDLPMFLSERSRVEVFRDGVLLSVQTLPAGSHILDTSALPDGAYQIRLRILGTSGRVAEETRFFSKTARVPPRGAPQAYLTLGRFAPRGPEEILPGADGAAILQTGVAARPFDVLGLSVDALAGDDQLYLTPGAVFQIPGLLLEGQGLWSTEGDTGFRVDATGFVGDVTGRVSLLHVNAADDDARPTDRFAFDPIDRSFTQATGQLTWSAPFGLVGLRGSWVDDGFGDDRTSFGPFARIPILRGAGTGLYLDAEATRQDDETLLFARLTFRRQPDADWRWSAGAGVERRPARGGGLETVPLAEASATRSTDLWGGRLEGNAVVSAAGDDGFAGARGTLRHPLARADAFADLDRRGGADPRWAVGGNLASNFAVDPDGVALGGEVAARAAVVVRVEGQARDAAFDVLVDNQRYGEVAAGATLVVPLPPYETYEVALRPAQATLTDLDLAPRSVTLFPATVARLTWDVTPITVVVGRIVDPQGGPVAEAEIDGAVGLAGTGPDGFFQAELRGASDLAVRPPGGAGCTVAVPVPPDAGPLFQAGELTCVPGAAASLGQAGQ